jgi:hypothetical protein
MSAAVDLFECLRSISYEDAFEDGFVIGYRESLVEQLTERFGSLPSNLLKRVNMAGLEQLRKWMAKFRTAETIEEVFAGARGSTWKIFKVADKNPDKETK